MKQRATALALGALALGVTGAGQGAADDGKRPCVAAYEEGQRQRNSGDLLRAYDQFAFCDSPQCPAIMHRDCEQWLAQVEASMPTVIFRAVDPTGLALPGALVSVDRRSSQVLDGRALSINPGQHDVVVDRPGYRPVSRAILVSEGEKLKHYDFTLTPATAPPSPLATAHAAGSAPPALDGNGNTAALHSAPVLAIVLTSAVGVLGGAGFAYWGLKARSGDRQLDSCSPFCDRSAVDDVKRDYLVANISLGVGLVGAVTAGLLLLIPAGKHPPPDPSGPRSADSGLQRESTRRFAQPY